MHALKRMGSEPGVTIVFAGYGLREKVAPVTPGVRQREIAKIASLHLALKHIVLLFAAHHSTFRIDPSGAEN